MVLHVVVELLLQERAVIFNDAKVKARVHKHLLSLSSRDTPDSVPGLPLSLLLVVKTKEVPRLNPISIAERRLHVLRLDNRPLLEGNPLRSLRQLDLLAILNLLLRGEPKHLARFIEPLVRPDFPLLLVEVSCNNHACQEEECAEGHTMHKERVALLTQETATETNRDLMVPKVLTALVVVLGEIVHLLDLNGISKVRRRGEGYEEDVALFGRRHY